MEDHSVTDYSRKDWVGEGVIPVQCLFSFLWLVIDLFIDFIYLPWSICFLFSSRFFLFYLFPLFPLFLSPKRDCMRGSVEYYNSFLEIRDLSDVLGTRVLCEKYSFTNPPFLFFLFSFLLCSLSLSNPPPSPTPDSQVSVFLCDSSRAGLFLGFLAFSFATFRLVVLFIYGITR